MFCFAGLSASSATAAAATAATPKSKKDLPGCKAAARAAGDLEFLKPK